MNISIPESKDNQLFEYLLVLDPGEHVRNRITMIKRDFFEMHRISSALTGKPNITLARFELFEMLENKLINRINGISSGIKPFQVELNGFGGYPMHSIFLKIQNQETVIELITSIKNAASLMKRSKKLVHFVEEPLIPIAIRLWKDKYVEVIKEYLVKEFSDSFIADNMLLLKRGNNQIKYQVIKRISFESVPVKAQQGILFS